MGFVYIKMGLRYKIIKLKVFGGYFPFFGYIYLIVGPLNHISSLLFIKYYCIPCFRRKSRINIFNDLFKQVLGSVIDS